MFLIIVLLMDALKNFFFLFDGCVKELFFLELL